MSDSAQIIPTYQNSEKIVLDDHTTKTVIASQFHNLLFLSYAGIRFGADKNGELVARAGSMPVQKIKKEEMVKHLAETFGVEADAVTLNYRIRKIPQCHGYKVTFKNTTISLTNG